MTDHGTVKETTPTRQGQSGTGARWVLRISLGLIVVIFAALFIGFGFFRHAGGGGQEAATERLSTTPNTVREAAATAPPASVPAQAAGRKEQTTGG
jgi:hypothetical protein